MWKILVALLALIGLAASAQFEQSSGVQAIGSDATSPLIMRLKRKPARWETQGHRSKRISPVRG
ncbi:self-1 [Pristionchus pacificus]|uniref:Uncharacterized protein n=1 Tax=Pristionchus pacificus TaxID=54126 RepID=A0A8R1Z4A2_PRIPA|nr:self-1 [Pristionchus pacificus]|eukprot:PDM60460.2 hypothetical protein PRIPAC_53438 [Pristionchus pacificus]